MAVCRPIPREVRRLATGLEDMDRLKALRTQPPGQLERDQCTHAVFRKIYRPLPVAVRAAPGKGETEKSHTRSRSRRADPDPGRAGWLHPHDKPGRQTMLIACRPSGVQPARLPSPTDTQLETGVDREPSSGTAGRHSRS